MNNCKCCVPCVCTGSGYEQACERHDTKMYPILPSVVK